MHDLPPDVLLAVKLAASMPRPVWGIFRSRETAEIAFRFSLAPVAFWGGCLLLYHARNRLLYVAALVLMAAGLGAILLPIYWQDDCEEYRDCSAVVDSLDMYHCYASVLDEAYAAIAKVEAPHA